MVYEATVTGVLEEAVTGDTTLELLAGLTVEVDEEYTAMLNEVDTGVELTVELPVSVAVTGQTVVDTARVLVTTTVEEAGQSVTVDAQEVMVISVVA